jgi:hypothetical protein
MSATTHTTRARASAAAAMSARVARVAVVASVLSCVGTTGSERVVFNASIAGPAAAVAGQPYVVESGRGYHVTISKASLHVGAVYLNATLPISGAQPTACTLPGIYVGEVRGGLDFDAISPVLQPFSVQGEGTSDHAQAAEVWLTGGAVDEATDPTVILELLGTAARGRDVYPFHATLHISDNRQRLATDATQPGANPICKQRIVSPIRVDLAPHASGSLVVRVQPEAWFADVDFAQMPAAQTDSGLREFADDDSDAASRALYKGLRATAAFSVQWVDF